MEIQLRGPRAAAMRAVAIIDDADSALVQSYKWRLSKKGYVRTNQTVNGHTKPLMLHRLLLSLTDPKVQGDHRDRNKLNNRRHNLRAVTGLQNQQNRDFGASGIRGVSWHRRARRWRAQAAMNRKVYHLGYFDSAEEAGRIARDWRLAHMP